MKKKKSRETGKYGISPQRLKEITGVYVKE